MQTELTDSSCFTMLMNAAFHIQHGNTDAAREELSTLLEIKPDPFHCAGDIQTVLFASALMKTCGGNSAGGNIQTRDYADKQVDLFNLIAKSFPIVSISKQIANETLFQYSEGSDNLALIDLGIAGGSQMLELLKLFSFRGYMPRKLTIVGIEPDEKSLAHAGQMLSKYMDDTDTEFRFIALPHCAEDLTPAQWIDLSGLEGTVIVNEAYSLHHIRPDGSGNDRKNAVLRRLLGLRPKVFVLTEQHSDHESRSLFSRFRSAWGHYGLAFRVVDRLPIDDDSKHAMKLLFFGREIEDVLANSEENRCERHELADMWINRLVKTGFIPVTVPLPRRIERSVVTVSRKDLYVGLECDGHTIVAIMAVKTPDFL
jgi:hypothetical protein